MNTAEQRWDKLHNKIDGIQEHLDRFAKEVRDHFGNACTEESADGHDTTSRRIETMLESAVSNVAEVTRRSVEQARLSLADEIKVERNEIKKHVTDLIAGDGDKSKSLAYQISSVHHRLSGLHSLQRSEEQWRETADGWKISSEELKERANKTQVGLDVATKEAERLDALSKGLQEQLKQTQKDLQKAMLAPGFDVLTRIMEIEAGGYVKVNRQTGRVDFGSGFEIEPAKSTEAASAEFKDNRSAEAGAGAVAKLASLFNVPLHIELTVLPGKSGSPAFWGEVATCQEKLFSELLLKNGVPSGLLTVKGQLAAKGAKGSSMFGQLNKDLFPTIAEKKDAGKSPGRR